MKGKTIDKHSNMWKVKMRLCVRCDNLFKSATRRGKICPKCEKPKGTPKDAKGRLK